MTTQNNATYSEIINSAFPPDKAALILRREQLHNRAKVYPVRHTQAPTAPTSIIIYQEAPESKAGSTLGRFAVAAALAMVGI